MVIHVVQPGESLYSIAVAYQVPMSLLIALNGLKEPSRLAVGQALVIRRPRSTVTVCFGDSLYSIAQAAGTTVRQLYRNNPALGGISSIWPGQTLVLSYEDDPGQEADVFGYAYPNVDRGLLRSTLPFLRWMMPFSYQVTEAGTLAPLDDQALISLSEQYLTAPVMHLSNLNDDGFSTDLAALVLRDQAAQDRLVEQVLEVLRSRGYQGLDVDFEYVAAQDSQAYAAFLSRLHGLLRPMGLPLFAALAPKVRADQSGALYEGHDYRRIGQAVDGALLMTYEWGYSYGPPMAVAPLPSVRQVVEYAVTEIPPSKLFLGIPAYGYDWPLPYQQGVTRSRSLSPEAAVNLAVRYGSAIQYDETAQTPWFRYRASDGVIHEVWFEDARSIQAKLELVCAYQLQGAGYWNLMRPFPQNWPVLDASFRLQLP